MALFLVCHGQRVWRAKKGEAMQAVRHDNSAQSIRFKDRRLTQRIQKTWKKTASGFLPSWCDIQSLDLGEDWENCFAVDLRLSDGFPYFIFLGDALCHLSNLYLSGESRWEMSLLDIATGKMDESALNRAPISYGDALRLQDGRRVLFRSVLLPLADNGVDVTHVFGAINGKGA